MKNCLCVLLLCCFFSCATKKAHPLFELVENSGIDFNNKVVDGELENSFYFRNFYNGGGVAIGDVNNDSLPDVMLTSNMGENKLYINRGSFHFEDVTAKAGISQDSMWSTGAVMADVNADGWLDIYVCNSGHMKTGWRKNQLWINNRNGTFTENAAIYGLDISAYSTQSSFFDYDLDGDLDMFLINNSPMPINNLGYENRRDLFDSDWPVAQFLKGGGDHLYRNDGGKFVEVTKQAGIHGTLMSFGLGVTIGDVNDDGYPDVYVANDSYERDYLYINQKNGTFKDEMEACMGQNSFSSMGADLSDINNDGHPDIFTTDMLPPDDYRLKTLGAFDHIDLHRVRIKTGFYNQYMKNCLMVNNKNGQFLETAYFSGVSATDWSWGALFFDADNDGLNDIFVCNGVNRDVTNLDFMDFFANDMIQKMVESGQKASVDSVLKYIPINAVANAAFKNLGGLRFADAAKEWGLNQPSFSNGAAYADLDNDGDLDLVVNNENQQAFVYRNTSREQTKNNYVAIQLQGKGGNPFAVGAKIKLFKNGEIFYRELIPSRGFQSSIDYKQVIGIGENNSIDSLIVIWPDRTYQKLAEPKINTVHYLSQPAGGDLPVYGATLSATSLFESLPVSFERHVEDDYVDFYYERNLPQMLSREGPHIAKGDVNSDGLEDLYIGGAKDQEGQLYLQTKEGSFQRSEQAVFKQFKDFEDVAVLFFDADKDGDLDLFIGAGGNNARPGAREIQHRLYKNDGKGKFEIDGSAFDINSDNISVAAAYDFDSDGDQDLFVGGRSTPFSYGVNPRSYLYQNNGNGKFTDITEQLNPTISRIGMVTGAAWADLDGDNKAELLITGQWMATRIFSFNAGKLTEWKNTGLENLFGWWQTISTADMDGDGKKDLIIGNIGENFYLRPNQAAPAKLWINDFDHNGILDQFLTQSIQKKDMPVFLKREITDQFPGLKKDNLKHSDFARKTIQDLFDNKTLAQSQTKQFNYTSSIIAFNNGDASFTIKTLPARAQLSNINAICITDIDHDGKVDLVTGGNLFTFPPQFGRLDASYGDVIMNKGNRNFQTVGNNISGINLTGEVKDIETIAVGGRPYLLFTVNNQPPVLYKLKD